MGGVGVGNAEGGGRGVSLFHAVLQRPQFPCFGFAPSWSPESFPFNWQIKRKGLEWDVLDRAWKGLNTWNTFSGLEVLLVIVREDGKCGPGGCFGRRGHRQSVGGEQGLNVLVLNAGLITHEN